MRIIRAKDSTTGGRSRSPAQTPRERAARQAAIESRIRQYIPLKCGHMTTLETDLGYSHWRPRKGVSFCENCGKWVAFKPNPITVREHHADPLF